MSVWTAVGAKLSFGADDSDVFGVSLAADAYGGFKAFWTQTGAPGDASGTAVLARRYGSDLTAGADLLINTSTAGDQVAGAVIALADGGSAYVWADASGTDDAGVGIKSKWFYSDAVTSSWEMRVNPGIAGDQVAPVVAPYFDGVYYAVGWTDLGVPSGAALRVAFYDDRTRVGNVIALGAYDRAADQLALAADYDRIAAVWRERGDTSDTTGVIRSQLFSLYSTIGSSVDIGTGTGNARTAWLADGRIVFVWDVIESNGSAGVRARIFNEDGTPDSAELAVNASVAGQQSDATIVALPAGGFAVFWTESRSGNQNVAGRLFDNAGVAYGEELRIGGADDQYDPVVTALASGELLVSWTHQTADGDRDVLAQRFTVPAAPPPVGTAGDDRLTGSTGADTIDGLAGNDSIEGSAGGDTLIGGDGDDRLVGERGGDTLLGGAGNDWLSDDATQTDYYRVGPGNDLLDGGAGDDVIAVRRANDPAQDTVTMMGGEGNDELSFIGSGSVVDIDAGAGDDLVRLYLNNADVTLSLGAGRDVIRFEEAFPDYFRTPTLRVTDFVTGDDGDQVDLSRIVASDALRTGALALRQNGDDVELVGRGPNPVEVVLATFAGQQVAAFTSYNFSGMALPMVVEIGDGAVYENGERLVGLPAVRIAGDDATLRNLAGGSIEKTPEDAANPASAAITITGAGATIENEAGGAIIAQDGSYQAILGSDSADTVRNSGYIEGYVRLAGGADLYVEQVGDSNSYDRFVDLGAGDDRATFDLSTLDDDFIVSVEGGAGDDRLDITGIGQGEEIRVNTIAGVETIALEGRRGASVSITRNGQMPDTLILSAGLTASIFHGNIQVYTGPAMGDVLLAGGSLTYGNGTAFDRIVGSEAAERVRLEPRIFPPSTTATATNSVDLGGGNDTFDFFYGNTAPLAIEGGAGRDTLNVSLFDDRLDLSAFHGFETIDLALAIGRIPLDPFVLTGVGSDAELLRVSGFARENALLLDLGARDTLTLALVEQRVIVGAETSIAKVVVDGATSVTDQSIENRGTIRGSVTLGDGADTFANSGVVEGVVRGGAGDDIYRVDATFRISELAGEGSDTVVASLDYTLPANVEQLTLVGTDGYRGTGNTLANTITGSDGRDVLKGLAGNDTLAGGGGTDTLTGGGGADRFVFGPDDTAATAARADRITDFARGQGDRIDLQAIDADIATAGDDAFAFIAGGAFTGVAGQLRIEQVAGSTYVLGDVNGDGAADFQIRATGTIAFVAGDFVL